MTSIFTYNKRIGSEQKRIAYKVHFLSFPIILTLLHSEQPKLYGLTLLHSEWPKLHRVLAILSALGLTQP